MPFQQAQHAGGDGDVTDIARLPARTNQDLWVFHKYFVKLSLEAANYLPLSVEPNEAGIGSERKACFILIKELPGFRRTKCPAS
jgi:hypothetical protein